MATLNDLEFQIVQGNYVLYIQLKLETDVSYKISYVYAIYSIITQHTTRLTDAVLVSYTRQPQLIYGASVSFQGGCTNPNPNPHRLANFSEICRNALTIDHFVEPGPCRKHNWRPSQKHHRHFL